MHQQLKPMRSRPHQRGITLIESLVAIIVAALGILGILGVQMRTLTDTQTSVRRAQAIRLIEDLSERLRINPNALALLNDGTNRELLLTQFDAKDPSSTLLTQCKGAGKACTPAQLAEYDLAVWRQTVKTQLPLGTVQTFLAPNGVDGNRRLLGVMVAWRENERADADAGYKSAINASQGGGDDNTCQPGYVCHLQYIAVADRCPPDINRPGQLFCPNPKN